MTRVTLGCVVVAAAAYGWWETGQRPFRSSAYLSLGVAVTGVLALYIAASAVERGRGRAGGGRRRVRLEWPGAAPWLCVVTVAVALEVAGLVVGGRSPRLPTLSTTVDHLLVAHWERWTLFCAWIGVGAWPALRRLLDGERA